MVLLYGSSICLITYFSNSSHRANMLLIIGYLSVHAHVLRHHVSTVVGLSLVNSLYLVTQLTNVTAAAPNNVRIASNLMMMICRSLYIAVIVICYCFLLLLLFYGRSVSQWIFGTGRYKMVRNR
jgi:hypothetical protein